MKVLLICYVLIDGLNWITKLALARTDQYLDHIQNLLELSADEVWFLGDCSSADPNKIRSFVASTANA
jgi:hypothetical protein